MRLFGRSKREGVGQTTEPQIESKGGVKVNQKGDLSGEISKRLKDSSPEHVSTLIELAKAQRLEDLGYKGNYDDRVFDIPQINTENRVLRTIKFSIRKPIDLELFRKTVANELFVVINQEFLFLNKPGQRERYVLTQVADGEEEGRKGTSYMTFGDREKQVYTGINVYISNGGKGYDEAIRQSLVIEVSSDAQRFDKNLNEVIRNFANKVVITDESTLIGLLHDLNKE